MVAARMESSGADSGLDHRCANDLFRIAIRLASSGIDRAERIGLGFPQDESVRFEVGCGKKKKRLLFRLNGLQNFSH
jgi:hypothetical protein